MKKYFLTFAMLFISALVLSPFSNCASVEDSLGQGQQSLCVDESEGGCEDPKALDIALNFHLKTHFTVRESGTQRTFEVGGFCNVGKYYESIDQVVIQWRIVNLNGETVFSGTPVSCIDGVFFISQKITYQQTMNDYRLVAEMEARRIGEGVYTNEATGKDTLTIASDPPPAKSSN